MSEGFHTLSASDSESELEPAFDVAPSHPPNSGISPPQAALKTNKLSKQDKAEKLRKLKHILPASCLNFLSISVDESVYNNPVFNIVIAELKKSQVPLITHKNQPDSIVWIRKQISEECTEEPHILILWDHVTCIQNIGNDRVSNFFEELKKTKATYRKYLVIYGLRDFCRRKKKKTYLTEKELAIKSIPPRDKIEHTLCQMQLVHGLSHRLLDDHMALVTFVNKLTKSVAEEPYRMEKEKIEKEKTSYLQGSSRSCVKIDKQNNGMKRLWIQQLAQIPMSSLDYAKSIASLYPSPCALYRAYNNIYSKEERENLLENIAVGREGSKKRLGPEMSKKICLLFSPKDIA